MTDAIEYAIQNALLGTLRGDGQLSALASGIFEDAPAHKGAPYIALEEIRVRDASTMSSTGGDVVVHFFLFSRQRERTEITAMMQRVVVLLHRQSYVLASYRLLEVQFLQSTLKLEKDGKSWRGAMQFGVMWEEV